MLKVSKHFSANSTVSATVEAWVVHAHVSGGVHVVVVNVVGLDDDRASGGTWGNGWDNEAMSDEAEVSVNECVIELDVSDQHHGASHDVVNIFSQLFDGSKKM